MQGTKGAIKRASNYERAGKLLELLKAGLGPFVQREINDAIESHRLGRMRPAAVISRRRFPPTPLVTADQGEGV